MKKLSIITINYNNLNGLIKTTQSVFDQTYKDYEYLIIDGQSTDGGAKYLEQNANLLNYWISEKDNGVYNAMNKGILRATGEYILFLNSGDFLVNDRILEQVIAVLDSQTDIYYGNLIYSKKGIKTQLWTPPNELTFSYFLNFSLPHPASFIKRALFLEYGNYNENLKIVSDWEFFFVCICKMNTSYKHLNFTISDFDDGGLSSLKENLEKIDVEKKHVYQQHFPAFFNEIKSIKEIETKRFKQYFYLKNNKFRWKIIKGFMSLLLVFTSKDKIGITKYYQKLR